MKSPSTPIFRGTMMAAATATVLLAVPVSAHPVITEFMADNESTLADADGAFEDWIEIHNPTGEAIDLGGYALTDNASQPRKWVFPHVTLPPLGYLVVFASNKDRTDPEGELHTDFELDAAGEYLGLSAPDGTVVSEFAPTYPPQFEDESYGIGLPGTVVITDLTPEWVEPGEGDPTYANVRLKQSLSTISSGNNHLDNGSGEDDTQRYLWLDFSSRFADLPAGHRVLSADFAWDGEVRTNFGAVTTEVGLFRVPDGNLGMDTIGASYSGSDIIDYYAAHTPLATGTAVPGETVFFRADLTGEVQRWLDEPADPQRGQLVMLHETRPMYVKWATDSAGSLDPGATLMVRTTNAPSLEQAALYHDAPTPGEGNVGGTPAGPIFGDVTENPPQPVQGPLTITAEVLPLAGPVSEVRLVYREMFGAEATVVMHDDGEGEDAAAGDAIYTGVIPASAIEPARMTRWRFEAVDEAGYASRLPANRDPDNSHRYFGTVGHDPSIESNLSVLHWFIQNPSGANNRTGAAASIYYLGEFYDNVKFSLHGQSTSGFIKKSYNLDFPGTLKFRWDETDEAPRVRDIDLLTNWADKSKVRHVLAYELMREAGVKAHFAFTVRVQQNGEFFSTADFVEDADDRWLRRVGLNEEGALYKVYDNTLNADAGDNGNQGVEKKNRRWENNTDLTQFIQGLDRTGAAWQAYVYDNVDIPAVINMMAVSCLIRNTDMHRKNWYLYRDSGRTDEWRLLPWDLDLSFGRKWNGTDNYFDNRLYADGYVRTGTAVRLVSQIFTDRTMNEMIMRRIRTLSDLYLQPPGTPYEERWLERRLDEQTALIDPPEIDPSDARLDFMKWGSWIQSNGSSRPYTYNHPDMEDMAEGIARWKDEYLPQRRMEIYTRQLRGSGGEIAAEPQPSSPSPTIEILEVEFSPESGNQDEEYIQLRNPNAVAVDLSFWRLAEAVDFTFEGGTVIPSGGTVYVVPDKRAFRERTTGPGGGEARFVVGGYDGHLSSFGETIRLLDQNGAEVASLAYVGEPSDAQRFLRIAEILYNPLGDAELEFVELVNTSDSVTLDLAGVRFVAGIEFDFTGSAVTQLAPGARVLVVQNAAAFEAYHGASVAALVAGEFANGTRLSNSGEELDLVDATGSTILKFSYNDGASWPARADGQGASLVLLDPAGDPDPSDPASWAASSLPGGNPGGRDGEVFGGTPGGDEDGDGIPDIVEWAMSGSTTGAGPLTVSVEEHEVGGSVDRFLTVRVPHHAAGTGVGLAVETSRDLKAWLADAVPVASAPGAGGTVIVSYRTAIPVSAFDGRAYVRVRAVYEVPAP